MLIKRLQVSTEALWNAAKNDSKFFAPVEVYIKNLAEFDYSQLNREEVKMMAFYASKLVGFWKLFDHNMMVNPASVNEANMRDVVNAIGVLSDVDDDTLVQLAAEAKPQPKKTSGGGGAVFIGHGRSKLWSQVQLMLQNDLGLKTEIFENESRAGQTIVPILEGFLDTSSFAVIIMTAEDETGDGKVRARQNVIHEVGLFQGRLGFDKVFILKQDGVEEFSNIAGLQYIPFSGDNIHQTFWELQRVLKKHGFIK